MNNQQKGKRQQSNSNEDDTNKNNSLEADEASMDMDTIENENSNVDELMKVKVAALEVLKKFNLRNVRLKNFKFSQKICLKQTIWN